MKQFTIFVFLISLLSFHAVQGQTNSDLFLTKSLGNEAIQKIYARTSGGSIEVAGISTGETRLEVYVRANKNRDNNAITKEEIRKRMEEDYELIISTAENQLNVTAKSKIRFTDWKRSLNISFKIFVKRNVSTDLSTSGGSISLSNLSGNQNFSTSGGSLRLEKLKGEIDGKTSGGNITIKDSGDDIDLRTSGGSIQANNCSGKIKLATSGGSLNLKNLEGAIDARTSGGTVTGNNIKGELITHTSGGNINLNDMACSLDAGTSGGSVNVAMLKLGKYVKLGNSGSGINLTLPDKMGLNLNVHGSKISIDALKNFSGKKEDDEISGTLHGGGIPITVRAGSGKGKDFV